ncbi:MAG: hypothetical protein KDC05_03220, partial [Bacteroidales bacterium]|nr:hypothetical protein [Bacteroidales bacterium]
YLGTRLFLYPTLQAVFEVDLFCTWNLSDAFAITPVVNYNSFNKINAGLALNLQAGENIMLMAGSSYLNRMFSAGASAGSGGFIKLVYIR